MIITTHLEHFPALHGYISLKFFQYTKTLQYIILWIENMSDRIHSFNLVYYSVIRISIYRIIWEISIKTLLSLLRYDLLHTFWSKQAQTICTANRNQKIVIRVNFNPRVCPYCAHTPWWDVSLLRPLSRHPKNCQLLHSLYCHVPSSWIQSHKSPLIGPDSGLVHSILCR